MVLYIKLYKGFKNNRFMIDDLEREALVLLYGGVASTKEEARERVQRTIEQRQKSNLVIFYEDFGKVRGVFEELFEESDYKGGARYALLPSGCLGRVRKNGDNGLVLASLKELVSEDKLDIRIVAFAKGFPYNGKEGLFLTPWNGEELKREGKRLLDERSNLERIEFGSQFQKQPDYVTAMLSTWREHPLSEDYSLVLYIPKEGVTTFNC